MKASDIYQYGLLQLAVIYFGTVTTDQNIGTMNRNARSDQVHEREGGGEKKKSNIIWYTANVRSGVQLSVQFPLLSWQISVISH